MEPIRKLSARVLDPDHVSGQRYQWTFTPSSASEAPAVESWNNAAMNLMASEVMWATEDLSVEFVDVIDSALDCDDPRMTLELRCGDGIKRSIGIRIGLPRQDPRFPRYNFFKFEEFALDPGNPDACGLCVPSPTEARLAVGMILGRLGVCV